MEESLMFLFLFVGSGLCKVGTRDDYLKGIPKKMFLAIKGKNLETLVIFLQEHKKLENVLKQANI